VVAVGLAVSLGGCAGRDVDTSAGATPELVLPTDMILMPITDERPPGPDAVDVSHDVRSAALRLLRKRGYVATPRDELDKRGVAAPATLVGAAGSDLAPLGPRDAGPLVFLAVDRVDQSYGYGGDQFRVVVSGVIVDPRSEKIVWQGKGTGTTSLGGFLRILAPQSTAYDAVYEAVRDLLRALPKAHS
jgi:hypothetical protein